MIMRYIIIQSMHYFHRIWFSLCICLYIYIHVSVHTWICMVLLWVCLKMLCTQFHGSWQFPNHQYSYQFAMCKSSKWMGHAFHQSQTLELLEVPDSFGLNPLFLSPEFPQKNHLKITWQSERNHPSTIFLLTKQQKPTETEVVTSRFAGAHPDALAHLGVSRRGRGALVWPRVFWTVPGRLAQNFTLVNDDLEIEILYKMNFQSIDDLVTYV